MAALLKGWEEEGVAFSRGKERGRCDGGCGWPRPSVRRSVGIICGMRKSGEMAGKRRIDRARAPTARAAAAAAAAGALNCLGRGRRRPSAQSEIRKRRSLVVDIITKNWVLNIFSNRTH